MDGGDDRDQRRPLADYVRMYNDGYPLHEIQRVFRERGQALQHPMSLSAIRAETGYSLDRYRDSTDEKSSKGSEAEWTSGEEEERGLMSEKELGFPALRARAYNAKYSRPRRPLIHNVHNEWRTNPIYGQAYIDEVERFGPRDCIQVITAKRLKRVVGLILAIVVFSFVAWNMWLGPQLREHLLLRGSLDDRMSTGQGWFGANMRPIFNDMIQLETLSASLVPTSKNQNKRLVVVGDVHGCKEELVALLNKLSFDSEFDHLVLAGDLISKGPSSADVVSLAMSLNASCVRGNHEDRVLLAYRDMNSRRLSNQATISISAGSQYIPHASQPYDLDGNQFPHGDLVDRALAASLSKEQVDYLTACPVILRIGQLSGMGEVDVVHAGLVPGVDLERQDPGTVMSMRTIDLGTHVPSRDSNGGVPWTKLWNKYQGLMPKRERRTVVYGHDSKRGLVLEKYSKGLDTGCVKGGKLTAMVIESRSRWSNRVSTRIVSVGCKDYRPRDLDVLGQA